MNDDVADFRCPICGKTNWFEPSIISHFYEAHLIEGKTFLQVIKCFCGKKMNLRMNTKPRSRKNCLSEFSAHILSHGGLELHWMDNLMGVGKRS